jgi:hypothetical protein
MALQVAAGPEIYAEMEVTNQTYTLINSVDELYDGLEFTFMSEQIECEFHGKQGDEERYYYPGPFIMDYQYLYYYFSSYEKKESGEIIHNAKKVDDGVYIYVKPERNIATNGTPIVFRLIQTNGGWYIYDILKKKYLYNTEFTYEGFDWTDQPIHKYTFSKDENGRWAVKDTQNTKAPYIVWTIPDYSRGKLINHPSNYAPIVPFPNYEKRAFEVRLCKIDDMSLVEPGEPSISASEDSKTIHIEVPYGNYIYYRDESILKVNSDGDDNNWQIVENNSFDYEIPDLTTYSFFSLSVKSVNPLSQKESEAISYTIANVNYIDDAYLDLTAKSAVYNIYGVKVADSTVGLPSGFYIVKTANTVKRVCVK